MRATKGLMAISCLLLATQAQAATSPNIGTTAVAQNEVTGTQGNVKRALKGGDGVFQDERIVTGRDGSAQLLFRDETALTLGPNTDVILDSFVYDPNRKTGEMKIRAMNGAFRFITGSGPKNGYKIATPVATIGIRGTIIQFWVTGRSLHLQLDEGGATVCISPTVCTNLDKPGTYVVTNGQHLGGAQSNQKNCEASGGQCSISSGDQTLYIDFLGLNRLPDITPAAGPSAAPPPPAPPPPPGPAPTPPPGPGPSPEPGPVVNPPPPVVNPPPPVVNPPPSLGFPPITTGAGTVPPGLEKRDTLPPGLEKRGPTFLPPGQQKKGGG